MSSFGGPQAVPGGAKPDSYKKEFEFTKVSSLLYAT
jgi:hypothetical protein